MRQQYEHRSLPNHPRFPWYWPSSYFHSEDCYKPEEILFRKKILELRSQLNINTDYLVYPGTWFSEDSLALVHKNAHLWYSFVLPNDVRPYDVLSKNDFFIKAVDERFKWASTV